jgi:hypothetical protein
MSGMKDVDKGVAVSRGREVVALSRPITQILSSKKGGERKEGSGRKGRSLTQRGVEEQTC